MIIKYVVTKTAEDNYKVEQVDEDEAIINILKCQVLVSLNHEEIRETLKDKEVGYSYTFEINI